MKKKALMSLFMVLALLFGAGNLLSQAYQKDEIKRSEPSRYVFGTEESLLFPVKILGLVKKPGQYMVPYRTDLITLIAYAGGFHEDAKVSKIKIIRHAAADGRNGKSGRVKVYQVDVKKYFQTGDERQIPKLRPDDTILVGGSTTKAVNKVFDFVAKGLMLAQFYFLIKVANDR